jgi:hypothetical protein
LQTYVGSISIFKQLSHPTRFHGTLLFKPFRFDSLSILLFFKMKATVAVLSTMLVGALAAPQSFSNAKARNARRSAHKNAAREVLDENWAGAVIDSFNSGEIVQSVNTTFTVPTPSFPSDKSDSYTEYTTSAWVGIDGDNCNNLWQSGIDSTILPSGDISYYAWYEWYPADTQVIDLGTISAGDVSFYINSIICRD